jgi:CheY-like chemotaxis protein
MNKLLIVDDSEGPLEVMKNILERNGYIVKTIDEDRQYS